MKCKGKTISGKGCNRNVTGEYCWQHLRPSLLTEVDLPKRIPRASVPEEPPKKIKLGKNSRTERFRDDEKDSGSRSDRETLEDFESLELHSLDRVRAFPDPVAYVVEVSGPDVPILSERSFESLKIKPIDSDKYKFHPMKDLYFSFGPERADDLYFSFPRGHIHVRFVIGRAVIYLKKFDKPDNEFIRNGSVFSVGKRWFHFYITNLKALQTKAKQHHDEEQQKLLEEQQRCAEQWG